MLFKIPDLEHTKDLGAYKGYRYFIVEKYNKFTYFPRWYCAFIVLGHSHEALDAEKLICFGGITFDENILGFGRVIGFDFSYAEDRDYSCAEAVRQSRSVIAQLDK